MERDGLLRVTMVIAAAVTAVALLVTACGSSGATSSRTHTTAHRSASARVRQALGSVSVSPAGSLPAPVEDAAIAPLAGGRLAMLGGIDAAQTSTDAIVTLSRTHAAQQGTLPNAQHDAQAATLGSDVYVFGGGQLSTYDHILGYDPSTGNTSVAGTLPAAASDVAVVSIGHTAYIVGGYDGASWLATIIAWSPGSQPRVVAHLPVGLRYAAVAAAGEKIIIAGGYEPNAVSDQILSFDPTTGAVSQLGHLPFPLTHASAVFVDGRVVVVGGRREENGDQTTAILAIDPVTGAVSTVGRLPQPLSDAAVALSGGRIVVAGGDNGSGPQSSILALTPGERPAPIRGAGRS